MGVTIFLRRHPSASGYPAPGRPPAASVAGSPPPATAAAAPHSRPDPRTSPSTGTTSFSTPMICSSLNRLPRIVPSFGYSSHQRTLFQTGPVSGEKVMRDTGYGSESANASRSVLPRCRSIPRTTRSRPLACMVRWRFALPVSASIFELLCLTLGAPDHSNLDFCIEVLVI